jgi:hypothetical protein
MKQFIIWDAVSMAWTEVGLSPEEYPKIARELRANYDNWDEVNDIILGDVLGSFALVSSLLPLAIIPIIGLFLIAPFPDWGYEKSYLEKRIAHWERYPRWRHYLNPLRLIGYPIAYLLSIQVRSKLKRAYLAAKPVGAT